MHHDVYDLWLASSRQKNWVLEDLIQMGDQVVLAGPPKSFKSIWALQLSLALAMGEPDFLEWRIPQKRKVLYFSMEMGESLVGERLAMQIGSSPLEPPFVLDEEHEKIIRDLPLWHIFEVNEHTAVDVCDKEDFIALRSLIEDIDPEVVIFDSFVRFHRQDENSNTSMSWAMRQIRELCLIRDPLTVRAEACHAEVEVELQAEGKDISDLEDGEYAERMNEKMGFVGMPAPVNEPEMCPVADSSEASSEESKPVKRRYRTGIIIHHNRKEPGFGKTNFSVSAMRGASSIHSEVDLAIAAFVLRDDKISLNYSARKVSTPKYEEARFNPTQLRLRVVTEEEREASRKKKEQKRIETKVSVAEARVPRLCEALKRLQEDTWTWDDVWAEAQKLGDKTGGRNNVYKKYEKYLRQMGVLEEVFGDEKGRFRLILKDAILDSTDEKLDVSVMAERLKEIVKNK